MAVLIDASILIETERGRLDLDPHVQRHGEEEAFLSVVTASELLHGVHRATAPDIRARRLAFVEGLLERFPLLTIDLTCARAHAQLWADLRQAGARIAPHDLWLAATCVAHGLIMVTANAREFSRVSGLDLEVWAD